MKHYLKLIRPYGMLFIGLTPVFGAIANGENNLQNLMMLAIIGLLVHIFGFVQNDYYDVEIDRKSKYVSDRPHATRDISKKTIITIIMISYILSIILTIFFFLTVYSFLMINTSFLCSTLYNKFSKSYSGMEYVLSLGIFSLGIFGALTVSNHITTLAVLISATVFMHWLFSVGVSANLKDVEYDSKLGIRTTPMVFGVQVINKKLIIPLKFNFYTFFIKIIHVLIAALSFILGYTSIFLYDIPIPGICFIIISISLFYLTSKILSTPLSKRDNMLIYIGLQEGLALLLIPIILMSYLIEKIALFPTIFLILLLILWPLVWFRILYGKKMIPLE